NRPAPNCRVWRRISCLAGILSAKAQTARPRVEDAVYHDQRNRHPEPRDGISDMRGRRRPDEVRGHPIEFRQNITLVDWALAEKTGNGGPVEPVPFIVRWRVVDGKGGAPRPWLDDVLVRGIGRDGGRGIRGAAAGQERLKAGLHKHAAACAEAGRVRGLKQSPARLPRGVLPEDANLKSIAAFDRHDFARGVGIWTAKRVVQR